MNFHVEPAKAEDHQEMLALLPRLGSFDIPNDRNPKHLWGEDAKMLADWVESGNDDCLVHIAKDDAAVVIGLTIVSLRPEMLSRSPSAHLEVIVVAKKAEGHGVAKALLHAAEGAARERGAQSMSLHVFASNTRARRVYRRDGYHEELLRCIKPFTEDALR